MPRWTRAWLCAALLLAGAGCGGSEAGGDDGVAVGLLLSYSGPFAANSTSSERAVTMAVEAANRAGALGGRRLHVAAADTRSEPTKVTRAARDLLGAKSTIILGPDTTDIAVNLLPMLAEHTLILPSFATAHSPFRRPPWWFVMGAGTARVACDLNAQLRVRDRKRPLVVVDNSSYNVLLAWELTRTFGVPQFQLPATQGSTKASVAPIVNYAPDSILLLAQPATASSFVFAFTAGVGSISSPDQWYLSPTLHTPAFLETIPKGALDGAQGVAAGTVTGATDFSMFFKERWGDLPLDDAYPFYDAAAVAILALERALVREGAIPTGAGTVLAPHVRAVSATSNLPVQWNQLARGIELLRLGQEVGYVGLSGTLEFDLTGETPTAPTNWWTIGPAGFSNTANQSTCL